MPSVRRRYTREFRLDAWRLIDEGRPVAEVARNPGVHVNTFHGWRQQFAAHPQSAFRWSSAIGAAIDFERRV